MQTTPMMAALLALLTLLSCTAAVPVDEPIPAKRLLFGSLPTHKEDAEFGGEYLEYDYPEDGDEDLGGALACGDDPFTEGTTCWRACHKGCTISLPGGEIEQGCYNWLFSPELQTKPRYFTCESYQQEDVCAACGRTRSDGCCWITAPPNPPLPPSPSPSPPPPPPPLVYEFIRSNQGCDYDAIGGKLGWGCPCSLKQVFEGWEWCGDGLHCALPDDYVNTISTYEHETGAQYSMMQKIFGTEIAVIEWLTSPTFCLEGSAVLQEYVIPGAEQLVSTFISIMAGVGGGEGEKDAIEMLTLIGKKGYGQATGAISRYEAMQVAPEHIDEDGYMIIINENGRPEKVPVYRLQEPTGF